MTRLELEWDWRRLSHCLSAEYVSVSAKPRATRLLNGDVALSAGEVAPVSLRAMLW